MGQQRSIHPHRRQKLMTTGPPGSAGVGGPDLSHKEHPCGVLGCVGRYVPSKVDLGYFAPTAVSRGRHPVGEGQAPSGLDAAFSALQVERAVNNSTEPGQAVGKAHGRKFVTMLQRVQ